MNKILAGATITTGTDGSAITNTAFDTTATIAGNTGTDELITTSAKATAINADFLTVSGLDTLTISDPLAGNLWVNYFNTVTTLNLESGTDATIRTIALNTNDIVNVKGAAVENKLLVIPSTNTIIDASTSTDELITPTPGNGNLFKEFMTECVGNLGSEDITYCEIEN